MLVSPKFALKKSPERIDFLYVQQVMNSVSSLDDLLLAFGLDEKECESGGFVKSVYSDAIYESRVYRIEYYLQLPENMDNL